MLKYLSDSISPKVIISRLKSQSTYYIWRRSFILTLGEISEETVKKYIEAQG
jgi:hypothetical protein